MRRFMCILCVGLTVGQARADEKNDFAKWEKSIAAFEEQEKQKAVPKDGIVFVGSSSIKLWNVEKSFPNLPVVNRGFGGSQIADSVHFVDRLVLKHAPKTVVFYAGDNDIASGKSPQTVLADFVKFEQAVHKALPKTKLIFIAIKPSTKRVTMLAKQQEANALIETACKKQPNTQYLDVVKPMLDKAGQPRDELFRDDKLHLNDKGYELWNDLLKPLLKE